jgi:RNA polymerase sigma factor (sigma-70 family)
MKNFYIKSEQGDILTENDLFKLMFRALCFFAERLLHNKEEAEDMAGDAIEELWRRKHRFSELAQVIEFLYLEAYENCQALLQEKKAAAKFHTELEYLSSTEQFNLEEEILRAELFRHLDWEIDQLSPQRKRAYDLSSLIPAPSVEWMAAALGIKEQTFRNTKSQTIQILHEALKKKGLISIIIIADFGILIISYTNQTNFILTS